MKLRNRKKRKIQWYAACDGIVCMGPFASEVEAWERLETIAHPAPNPGSYAFGKKQQARLVHVPGARVWPAVNKPKIVETWI